MDRDLVAAKLESLRRCVERIADKTPPSSQDLAQAQICRISSRSIFSGLSSFQRRCSLPSHRGHRHAAALDHGGTFDVLNRLGNQSGPGGPDEEGCGIQKPCGAQLQAIDWNIVYQICSRPWTIFDSLPRPSLHGVPLPDGS
ncbi:MAG: hypothetical protein MRJ92_02335 [Nitrospira sp.]|nr:hypothetical protein [Nitrospira sp.]